MEIKKKSIPINILKPLPKVVKEKKPQQLYQSVKGKIQFYFSKRNKNGVLNHFYKLDDLTYVSNKNLELQIGQKVEFYYYGKKGYNNIVGVKK